MLEALLSAVITGLSFIIGYILVSKKADSLIKNTKKELKGEAEAWLNSEKGQKALYTIGVLVGNGVKGGFGIKKGKGKFKFEDIIGQIASRWIEGGGADKFLGVTTPSGAVSASSKEESMVIG